MSKRKPRHRNLAAFYDEFRKTTVEPALSAELSQDAADMIRLSMRMAYYSGALTIWTMLMGADGLDSSDSEPTTSDIDLMNSIARELKDFVRDIKRRNDEHTQKN